MKPIVTDIDPEKLHELDALLSTGKYGKWEYTMTSSHRNGLIKKYAGGICQCGNVPTKVVSYDISDDDMNARRIERYCNSCFTRLRATNGIDETVAVRCHKGAQK